MIRMYVLFIGLLLSFSVYANVRLPKIFGDNMVLQRNQAIPIWGWADVNENVTIQFNKQTKNIKAGKDGKWMIKLNAESAGGPFSLLVKAKNVITINNVLVGEVWICSGQSNMEWPVRNSNSAQQEVQQANYPQIRHFMVPKAVSSTPKEDINGGEWKLCSPETVGDFTAVGYFFARHLYNELKVPVGLINTSWGGTHVETWTSREAFEKSDEFREMIAAMPSINLDSLAGQRKEAARKKLETLQGPLKSASNAETWKEANVDDTNWPQMKLPGLWEQQQPGDMDGVIWFRKTIDISQEDADKTATLELAMIDDSDDSYINGVKVGSTKNKYNEKRKYNVPAGILKQGKNIIAVRVDDTGGGGGIFGDSADMKLTISNHITWLAGNWNFRVESVAAGASSVGPNSYPALLFNAMVNPLVPFAIKGALWYQGESNAGRAYQYRKAFPLMIIDWRKRWNQGDFPFLFVQLASFNAANGDSKNGSTWAELREAQTMTLSLPHTGMAVATDIGEAKDIHPRNKQDVGKRLASIALNKVYGKDVVYNGPMFQSMKTEGNRVILSFTNIGSGLVMKDKDGNLKGFEIAGSDQRFYDGKASIEGEKVVVRNDSVNNPIAVRFAWADNPEEANLFNKEGFPALPFRTDKWKGITEAAKFRIGQ